MANYPNGRVTIPRPILAGDNVAERKVIDAIASEVEAMGADLLEAKGRAASLAAKMAEIQRVTGPGMAVAGANATAIAINKANAVLATSAQKAANLSDLTNARAARLGSSSSTLAEPSRPKRSTTAGGMPQ